jgi:RDD family
MRVKINHDIMWVQRTYVALRSGHQPATPSHLGGVDRRARTQTIGKGVMGLKVITVNGGPLGVRPVLLRTVGRIIDVLPVFYLVGWIAMRGPHKPPQRLGDRIAGTTVVPLSHP